MAPPKVLVLGHSFVHRLKFDPQHQSDLHMSPSFKLEGTAHVYIHAVLEVEQYKNCSNTISMNCCVSRQMSFCWKLAQMIYPT